MRMKGRTYNDWFTRKFCRHTEKQNPGEWSFQTEGKAWGVWVVPRLSSSHIVFSTNDIRKHKAMGLFVNLAAARGFTL